MTKMARMNRREFLLGGLTAAAAVGCCNLGFSAVVGGGSGLSAVHNMLIIGTRTTFLYHLPMFSFHDFASPHAYQVILEASFSREGKNLGDVFAEERKQRGSQIYTFSPEKFILQDLVPKIKKEPLRRLSGRIFRGHLEKGGTIIFENVTAQVRVVYFREFSSKVIKSKSKSSSKSSDYLQYILFGNGPELFLAHFITEPPDFDQILPVTIPGHFPSPSAVPSPEEIKRGIVIGFPRTSNTISRRLKPGLRKGELPEKLGEIPGRGLANLAPQTRPLELLVDKEIYLEEGELRSRPEFVTTKIEKEAGFP